MTKRRAEHGLLNSVGSASIVVRRYAADLPEVSHG